MISSDNIYLRAPEPADIDLLYTWENDTSLWHLGSTIVPFSRFLLEQYVLSAENDIFITRQLRLMIVDSTSDNPVGTIDLFEFDPHNRRAGIGIMVQPDQRGKGYASEALDLMIDYAFRTLDLHQLHCNIINDNTVSLKLFEKHGFVRQSIQRDWLLMNGQWRDVWFLQLINPD